MDIIIKLRYLFLVALLVFAGNLVFGQNIKDLQTKAQNGSVSAQLELAKCYIDGNGVEQSQAEALKWYEKAAAKNNVEAMLACGDLLCDEWNVDLEPDYVKGMGWYRKAAAKGSQKAKNVLANFKIEKEAVSHDCPFDWLPCDEDFERSSELRKNIALINKAYEDKNQTASYYLSIISYLDKDYAKAVEYLKEAYPLVMNEDNYYEDILGDQDNGIPIGAMLPVKVFSLLGWCYEHGQGVDRDYKKAAEYYLSEFDYSAFGLSRLPEVRGAYCYKKGGMYDEFINETDKQGIGFAGGASRTYFSVPCLKLELAEMYKAGEGVPQDARKALEIYESIVDQRKGTLDILMGWYPEVRSYADLGRAAYRASKMYRTGEGCKADEDMADLYFEIALRYGDKNAWYEKENK